MYKTKLLQLAQMSTLADRQSKYISSITFLYHIATTVIVLKRDNFRQIWKPERWPV